MVDAQELFDKASSIESVNKEDAIERYIEIVNSVKEKSSEVTKVKEKSIYRIAELNASLGNRDAVASVAVDYRPFFLTLPKARAAKIVRSLVDIIGTIPDSLDVQIKQARSAIEWAKEQDRLFLRLRLETKLCSLLYTACEYTQALQILEKLSFEVRKMDDKPQLVEIHLLESKVHHSVKNLSKAKSSLNAARTAANTIYCPPLQQAKIDLMAGTIYADDDKDFATAYSYFVESYEGYQQSKVYDLAALSLARICMSRVMLDEAGDIDSLVTSKMSAQWDEEMRKPIEAIQEVAKAILNKSVEEFNSVLSGPHGDALKKDPVSHAHIASLYQSVLSKNVMVVLQPYSLVDIPYIASRLKLSKQAVEAKLAQMILDEELDGVMDHATGCLIIHSSQDRAVLAAKAKEVLSETTDVIQSLQDRAIALNTVSFS